MYLPLLYRARHYAHDDDDLRDHCKSLYLSCKWQQAAAGGEKTGVGTR